MEKHKKSFSYLYRKENKNIYPNIYPYVDYVCVILSENAPFVNILFYDTNEKGEKFLQKETVLFEHLIENRIALSKVIDKNSIEPQDEFGNYLKKFEAHDVFDNYMKNFLDYRDEDDTIHLRERIEIILKPYPQYLYPSRDQRVIDVVTLFSARLSKLH